MPAATNQIALRDARTTRKVGATDSIAGDERGSTTFTSLSGPSERLLLLDFRRRRRSEPDMAGAA